MSSTSRATARAAALAAAEARLRPPPTYDSANEQATSTASISSSVGGNSSGSGSGAGTGAGGLFARPSSLSSVDSFKPTEKDDRELRIKFGRLLDRGIIRDNGYRQSAEAVDTLIKIATNILTSDDPKYRTLKATNILLQTKILSVRGGQDYLIALGFRTQTINFAQHFVYSMTLKKRHEMEIGVEVLKDHTKALQDRVSLSNVSSSAHAAEEATRRANALREIEADRELVRARAERERIARAAREQMEKEKAEREAAAEAEGVADDADEERREMADAVVREADTTIGGEGEGDDELPSYTEDRESRRWGGAGRRLG